MSAALQAPPLATRDDGRLLRLAGMALAGAVWVLGIFPPPAAFGPWYVLKFTAAIAALVVVDQTAPSVVTPLWRRTAWLLLELALAFAVLRTQASLTRPSLIYLLPASRAC